MAKGKKNNGTVKENETTEIIPTEENEPVEVIEVTEETESTEVDWKVEACEELAMEFFEIPFEELSESQQEKIEAQVKKMRKPRKKVQREPKRTTGRSIAPTLRVKDEDSILEVIYVWTAGIEDKTYKGGWGQATPDSNLGEAIDKLKLLVSERKIVDDTIVVE